MGHWESEYSMQTDLRGAAWRRWAIAVPILVFVVVVAAFLVVTVVNSHQPEPQESVYPEEIFGIPVHTELLPETLPARPGERRTIKYVVIHETGNTAEGSDAAGHSAYLLSGKSGDTSTRFITTSRTMKSPGMRATSARATAETSAASAWSSVSTRTATSKKPLTTRRG